MFDTIFLLDSEARQENCTEHNFPLSVSIGGKRERKKKTGEEL